MNTALAFRRRKICYLKRNRVRSQGQRHTANVILTSLIAPEERKLKMLEPFLTSGLNGFQKKNRKN